jgi:nucleoside phosphorylase
MPLSHRDYTVACICPMGVELAPVKALLDQTPFSLPTQRDQNSYTLGVIGRHNIVIAVLPEIGTNSAATVATQLLNDFSSIKFGLLVGIGGGVPDLANEIDIRLSDIVVSKPTKTAGGVVQYDMGKETLNGFERTGTNLTRHELGPTKATLQFGRLTVVIYVPFPQKLNPLIGALLVPIWKPLPWFPNDICVERF